MGPLVLMTAVSQLVQLVLKALYGGLELIQLVFVVVVLLAGQGSFLGRYFSILTIDCVEVQGVVLELVLEQVHGIALASGARCDMTDNA